MMKTTRAGTKRKRKKRKMVKRTMRMTWRVMTMKKAGIRKILTIT